MRHIPGRFNRKLTRKCTQGMVPRRSVRCKTPESRAYWATFGRQVWEPSYIVRLARI